MILLLGGTSDSVEVASELKRQGLDLILSTATEYGESVAAQGFDGKIVAGAMDVVQMKDFCEKQTITSIVDATHPFARCVSETAMEVSNALSIPYVRYERPESMFENKDNSDSEGEATHFFANFEEACSWMNTQEGNILITTGSKDAETIYRHIHNKDRLYFRLLPLSTQLIKMEDLGLKARQIIAMQGPFSIDMNVAMIRQLKATILVSKESGKQGHVEEKLEATRICGIKFVVIERPVMNYPIFFSNVEALMEHVKQIDANEG
jgi:precorrin-6A/cobalt-precorrin-6A reductase